MKQFRSESTGELSGYDNHPADSATELYENEKDLALNEQAARRMQDIRNALERMENGTYGICSVCRQPIPIERLRALPTAERCANHADDRYVPDTRPLEEAVLQPPFGQTSMDDTSQTAFDGEDSWQTVESSGDFRYARLGGRTRHSRLQRHVYRSRRSGWLCGTVGKFSDR